MKGAAIALAAILLSTAMTSAQAGGMTDRPSVESLRRRATELRSQLLKKGNEVDRLMDIMVRHHLGLPVDEPSSYAITEMQRARPRAEAEAELSESQRMVSELSVELDRLRAQVRSMREKIMAGEPGEAELPAQPTEPTAADELAARRPLPHPSQTADGLPVVGMPPEMGVAAEDVELPPAAPGPETAPPDRPRRPRATAPDGPNLVRGTLDHGRMGRALFHAGEFEEARRELELAVKADDPPLLDVFMLARSYEKTGDIARADSIYLRIEAADTQRSLDGAETMGAWGVAAQVARQHMNWQRDHGTWKPSFPWQRDRQR